MKTPKGICQRIGCNNKSNGTYCTKHQDEGKKLKKEYNDNVRNKEHKQFYNSKEWRMVRDAALMRDLFMCVECRENGFRTVADVVDHISEMRDSWELRSELSNLVSLCHKHHNEKTQKAKRIRLYGVE